MTSDLKRLYRLSVSQTEPELRNLMRGLFSCPLQTDVINSRILKPVSLPSDNLHNFMIINSVFKNGGSVGRGSVIVNSIFEEETHVPQDSIIIDSHLISLDRDSQDNSFVYSFTSPSLLSSPNNESSLFPPSHPLSATISDRPLLLRDTVLYSAYVKPQTHSKVEESIATSGLYPDSVNPKDKPNRSHVYLDHYNATDADRELTYLEQSMIGFGGMSFKELLDSRRVSLRKTLEYLAKIRAETSV